MEKVEVTYGTIRIGSEEVFFKIWPAENGSNPDEALHYVSVLTLVDPSKFGKIENAISRKHRIKGISYPKS